ncbi:MAG: DoxX family protein [Planctomycetales bacterium]|nr:DoxX family protein [Planctomycetales bacterium]
MKRWLATVGALGGILGSAPAALAHEKWVRHGLTGEFDRSLFERPVAGNVLPALASLALLAALAWLARRHGPALEHRCQGPRWQGLARWTPAAVGLTVGASLLLSALAGELFAPDLRPDGFFWSVLLLGVETVLGAALVLGLVPRAAGFGLLALFASALLLRPFALFDGKTVSTVAVLNYLELAGVGAYVALAGRPRAGIGGRLWGGWAEATTRARSEALAWLRLGLGGTLLILGLQKFLVPELPMGVVQNYGDTIYRPFRDLLGISPEGYVFAASLVETTVGVALTLGLFTRVVAVVLLALFTLTAFIFQVEILGHLALAGPVVALLVEGGGAWRLENLRLWAADAIRDRPSPRAPRDIVPAR